MMSSMPVLTETDTVNAKQASKNANVETKERKQQNSKRNPFYFPAIAGLMLTMDILQGFSYTCLRGDTGHTHFEDRTGLIISGQGVSYSFVQVQSISADDTT